MWQNTNINFNRLIVKYSKLSSAAVWYEKNERIVCEGKIVVFEKVITTVFYEIIIIKVEGTIK